MLRDTKEIIINYSILGGVMGILTMLVRPYISVKQLFRDSIIVFVFTVLSGLVLEQWHDFMAEPVRTGIAGVMGFFAVRLYEVAVAVMGAIKENPSIITKRIDK